MRAISLLSGGLDSSLATKLIMDQGLEVIALKFTSPFCNCDSGGTCHAANIAHELGIELINVAKGEEYLEVVKNPKHGRGSGMNPCIDCRIFMLKKAKIIGDQIDAKFLFTGEVLGQRPMSQHRKALELIDRETGLQGQLLRPLSAKLFPPTEAEKMGWVDREKLLSISGRGRKTQMELAEENGIADYPCPAGGCLLTSKEFAANLMDHLLHHPDRLTMEDVSLLKVGRHFRVHGHKVIIGRNERENHLLKALANEEMDVLEPVDIQGPVCLVEGHHKETITEAAAMLARYSDGGPSPISVDIAGTGGRMEDVLPASNDRIDRWRIGIGENIIALD
jgi:tRNA U34 2-thiouridine synthase MnmA/TrmU